MDHFHVENARTYYESARAELVQRIRLRDTSLYLYMGGVGTIAGIALSEPDRTKILLVVPFLSLATAFIISNHHVLIGAIRAYCADLGTRMSGDGGPLPFDRSWMLKHFCRRTWWRSCSSGIPILLGTILALVANVGLATTFPYDFLWWGGSGCGVCSVFVILKAYRERQRVEEQVTSQAEAEAPSNRIVEQRRSKPIGANECSRTAGWTAQRGGVQNGN